MWPGCRATELHNTHATRVRERCKWHFHDVCSCKMNGRVGPCRETGPLPTSVVKTRFNTASRTRRPLSAKNYREITTTWDRFVDGEWGCLTEDKAALLLWRTVEYFINKKEKFVARFEKEKIRRSIKFYGKLVILFSNEQWIFPIFEYSVFHN